MRYRPTSHKTRRWLARAHVPARAQASFVGQCHALRMPPHRRSPVHDPLTPTMGTCAGHCFARAQQCPARADASWCTTPGLRVSATVRASRPCGVPALPVLRRLSHRPGQARRIAASGHRAALEGPPAALTPTALGRYRLPLLAPPSGTGARASTARECVGQDQAARHCGHALRRLRAQPQSR